MAKSKTGKAASATPSHPFDPDASPYAGLIAEVDEHLSVIRNNETDDGAVQRSERYLRNLMQTTRFKMALTNHQIRTAISGRLPF